MSKKVRAHGIRMALAYDVEVRDKYGKLLSKRKGKNDPFVKNWILALQGFYKANPATDNSITLTDASGNPQTFLTGYGLASQKLVPQSLIAGAGTDAFGVQVGASDVAFSKTQTSLQSKIPNATLGYGAVTVEAVEDEDSTSRTRIIRAFTNNTGSPQTVKEIGLVIANKYAAVQYYFLIARDVLASPQTVPDGATLTVRYRLYISYA